MANTNFFSNFVPSEKKESRFTLLPVGKHIVHIVDAVDMLASQAFKLSDDGQIVSIHDKAEFNKAADQAVLVLVYQDEEGRIMTDFRSTTGFMHIGDEGCPAPSAMKAAGMSSDDSGRILMKNGRYMTSPKRSEGCVSILSSIFNYAGASSFNELKGSTIGIEIGSSKNSTKEKTEVIRWFDAGVVVPETSEKAAGNATTATQDADDLPF